jgi:hypothetical protein
MWPHLRRGELFVIGLILGTLLGAFMLALVLAIGGA